MPIFFESVTGRLGYSVDDAVNYRLHDLLNGGGMAPLGMKYTTHIRINVSGILGASLRSSTH